MNGIELWRDETDGGGELKYAQKTDPMPLRPPQTVHELACKWTLAETASLSQSMAHKEKETAV